MDVVINSSSDAVPDGATSMTTYSNYYHNMLVCLGYPIDAPPVADWLRRYHSLEGEWVVVSPVHWQATHNDAMIIASGHELTLSEAESRVWFAELSEFVALYKIKLYYHDKVTWLLQCDGRPPITAKPVHMLHHQSLMPELKKLDETLFWQGFLTENQMFFSAHPLNQKRKDTCFINGLWLWGGGYLHECVQKPLLCSDDSLLPLAKLLSTDVDSYYSVSSIARDSVLMFTTLSQHDKLELQLRLQKNTVRWYWNNLAYLSKPKSWWSRFRAFL